jgi:hypothetical protein
MSLRDVKTGALKALSKADEKDLDAVPSSIRTNVGKIVLSDAIIEIGTELQSDEMDWAVISAAVDEMQDCIKAFSETEQEDEKEPEPVKGKKK